MAVLANEHRRSEREARKSVWGLNGGAEGRKKKKEKKQMEQKGNDKGEDGKKHSLQSCRFAAGVPNVPHRYEDSKAQHGTV